MSHDVDLRGLTVERGDTSPLRRRSQRQLLTRYVLPLVLLFGFLSLVGWAARDIVFPPKPVTVVPVISTTAAVRREGTPLFKAAGWVEPRPTPVRVAALAPGVIESLLVVEDQPVEAGEPIAVLVKDDAQLAFQRALADRKLQRAELEKAKAVSQAAETKWRNPVHLEAPLGEAEALLAKVETQLKNLPFELQRALAGEVAAYKDYQGKIKAKGVVSGIQIDFAKSKLDSAKALVEELRHRNDSLEREQAALSHRRDALKAQLKLLADEIQAKESAKALVEAAQARLDQAEVALAEAKLRLDRMTIRAPVAGRIFRLVTHPGAKVGGGMAQMHGHDGSTVVTMYRPDLLQIRVDVRFEDIPKIRLGQPVEIDNPALSSPRFGKVLFISSEADIQKNTLEVKVEIPDPPSVFKPEMLVDVTFLAPKEPEQTSDPSQELKLYLPKQLLAKGEGGPYVWVADQSAGVARKTKVQVGATGANGLVEITQGLNVSSRVISAGTDGLNDGDRILIAGEDFSFGNLPRGERK